jgi:cephalosporin hydroxylase|tara:strand:- start:314 stop:1090 length:777 start_codon:yes stop_codon:yes gene_type:complete
MNKINYFASERAKNVREMSKDVNINRLGLDFLCKTAHYNYSYNFDWLSRPIIQYPQDIIAFQEIVWRIKPDLIIEMGVARGGSLILSASLLAMIDLSEYGTTNVSPRADKPRRVLGVDIDIRDQNRTALESHFLFPRINLIEGSSIDEKIISKVNNIAMDYNNIIVCLDSNHTYKHVLAELEAYALLTSIGSYCIVFDTVIEDMPIEMHKNRPWNPGNSPKTAVREFIKNNSGFKIDKKIQDKLLITAAPDGFLKRIK